MDAFGENLDPGARSLHHSTPEHLIQKKHDKKGVDIYMLKREYSAIKTYRYEHNNIIFFGTWFDQSTLHIRRTKPKEWIF